MHGTLDATTEQWLKLWAASPQRSVFSHPDLLGALPVQVRFALVRDNSGDCAGAPVCLGADGRPIHPDLLPCLYHGVLTSGPTRENHSHYPRQMKLVERLLKLLTQEYPDLHLCNSWRLDDLRPVQWHNYHERQRGTFELALAYTAVLDLAAHKSFEHYLASIRSCRRQEYAKVMANPPQFCTAVQPDELLALYSSMFAAKGLPVAEVEAECLRGVCTAIQRKGLGDVFACREDGRLVAATVFLKDDRSAYYLYGMTAPERRKDFLNTALLLEAIRSFFYSGPSEVDFIGVNSPNRGDYKLSFNPALRPFTFAHFQRAAQDNP